MYKDGEKVLRAKIDMASSEHQHARSGYLPCGTYDSSQHRGSSGAFIRCMTLHTPLRMPSRVLPIPSVLWSLRIISPLYDWVVRELEYENPPRQIEFAKLYLTNVVTGKRYIKKLVEDGVVDGWDDPRLVSIAALRRRGFTPESIQMFVELCGVSKSQTFRRLCHAGVLHP